MSDGTAGDEREKGEEKKDAGKIGFSGGIALFRRFWPYLRPEKRLTIAIAALLLLAVPSGAIAPFLVKRIFDDILPRKDTAELALAGGAIIGLTLLSFAFRWVQDLASISLRNRVHFRVTRDVFGHVVRLPVRYFHGTDTGTLMSRVRDDVTALDGLMTDTLVQAGVDVLRAILVFVLLIVLDAGLALSGLLLVGAIFGFVLLLGPALRRRSARAREADEASSAALHEALTGLETIRTGAREPSEARRFSLAVKRSIRASASRAVLGSITGSAIGLTGVLGGYAIVAIGAYRIILGVSTFGGLFAFFIFLVELVGATGRVFGLAPQIQAALASLQRIYRLLDESAETDDPDAPAPPETVAGRIELRSVRFAYGSGDERNPALQGVDLLIEAGTVAALVGRSGSGKSTLAALLPRLLEPDAGEITLDGRPLRSLSRRWLRRRIGVVPQDVFLFNRSIRDNVAFARPEASDDEVRAALVAARADVFVDRLPRAWDTVVGERGIRVSGGEKQRLAIARELLRDPPILILDEATSSLDAESEALLRDAMARLLRGRTCLVIAHRLSTVRDADRIVVLDEGRVVEEGTHDELLATGGLYRELHDRQLVDARAGAPDDGSPGPEAEPEPAPATDGCDASTADA